MKWIVGLIQKYKPILILVFIPIGFTLLFGGAMSPIFVEDIPIVILDLDESDASREIVDEFRACPVFQIVDAASSAEEIREEILMGTIKGGLVLPDGFGKSIGSHKGTKALMLMDGSNFLVGNNLMLYANKIFTAKNSELQISYLEAGGVAAYASEQSLDTLALVDRTMYNPQLGYFYYLYPGLLGVFIQQTYLNVLTPVLLKEKERLKHMPMDLLSRRIRAREMMPLFFRYGGMSFLCSLSCLLIAHWLFSYPLKGSLLLILLIQVIFLTCLTGMAFILAAIFDDVTHCAQFIMFLAIPTMLSCGYGWPEFMMAPGFAAGMKLLWPLYFYSNPLKEILLKGAGFGVLGHFLLGGAFFAAFWLPVGMWIYRGKVRTMKQIG